MAKVFHPLWPAPETREWNTPDPSDLRARCVPSSGGFLRLRQPSFMEVVRRQPDWKPLTDGERSSQGRKPPEAGAQRPLTASTPAVPPVPLVPQRVPWAWERPFSCKWSLSEAGT